MNFPGDHDEITRSALILEEGMEDEAHVPQFFRRTFRVLPGSLSLQSARASGAHRAEIPVKLRRSHLAPVGQECIKGFPGLRAEPGESGP